MKTNECTYKSDIKKYKSGSKKDIKVAVKKYKSGSKKIEKPSHVVELKAFNHMICKQRLEEKKN